MTRNDAPKGAVQTVAAKRDPEEGYQARPGNHLALVGSSYASSHIKRRRRSKADMEDIREAIYDTLAEQNPMTVRGLFYQLVSTGIVKKTEREYDSTVIRLAGEMRRAGVLPYEWLADNTRWMRKNESWESLGDMLTQTARFYRRALWAQQDAYVEVWLEKEALAGVIFEVTNSWDVPLMVTRGYASLSFLHSAAEVIASKNKPVFLYYLGDHDPSGVNIPVKVEQGIRELAPDADLTLTRLAVLPEQIVEFDLPTRPTKATDSRSKGFVGESVEVDAIPAEVLRQLVHEAIAGHVDRDRLAALELDEQLERETLAGIAQRWGAS